MSGKKGKTSFVTLILLGLMLHSNLGHAATYNVGDSTGWTFNVAGWGKGKKFKAGDTLVFNYSPNTHSVVAVNKSSYGSCNVPPNAKKYKTGSDQITLVKGSNYFICGVPGHGQLGMLQIAAKAA